MALQYKPRLLQLSDDVILHIMSFLNARDVFVLGQVCTRLEKIAKDRTLWRHVDFRPYIMKLTDLKRAMGYLTEHTDFLALSGTVKNTASQTKWKTENLTPGLFKLLKKHAPNLRALTLEEHHIDASRLEFSNFPSSLKRLNIIGCELANIPIKQSYFFNISTLMPDLEVLVLDGCKWFEDHSLMAISKCPKLVELRARGCVRIGSCAAYIYLAARFGFERLEFVDLRETMVGDGELLSLQYRQTLTQLYLDGRLHRKNNSHEFDRINDKSMFVLGRSTPRLEVLVVTNTEVTDTTLRHLARNLPWLKFLDLRGSRATEDGVLQLRRSLPDLKVLCDFPAVCDDMKDLNPSWLFERNFVKVENTPKPEATSQDGAASSSSAAPEAAGPTVEIVFVEPGVVRLRRIADPAREPLVQPVAVLMRQPLLEREEADPQQQAGPGEVQQREVPDDN